MSAGQSITGSTEDVSTYGQILIGASTSASGTLTLQYSIDGVLWPMSETYGISSPNVLTLGDSPPVKYFRLLYGNGASPASTVRIQTTFKPIPQNGSLVVVSQQIQDNLSAIVTKSVITGKTTAGSGKYVEVKVSPAGAVQVGGTLDAVTEITNVVNATGSVSLTRPITGSVGITGPVYVSNIQSTSSSSYTPVRITDGTSWIDSVSHDGGKHLSVALVQDVKVSQFNNSSVNLSASMSFTGSAETTLGVAGIQVNVIASERLTVFCQQSNDGLNWDITDTWVLNADHGDGRTIQAVSSLFRIIVKNEGSSLTTYFRLLTALCPVVEALPRTLSQQGNFRVAIREQQPYADAYAGRSFSSIYEGVVGTAETPFILLNNPSGSMRDVTINKLIADVVTKGTQCVYRFYANPTVTNVGTPNASMSRKLKLPYPVPV
jgi:hypothetical protein